MINEKNTLRHKILNALYQAGGKTVSGTRLSSDLKVSRVAVWKHINALKKNGIDIESSSNGYYMLHPENLILPFCFKEDLQNKIFHYHEIDSTMDKARQLAKEGAEHLSVVIAEKQTKGRGRLNRNWFSSKGGLWFTIILKPQTPPPLAYIYNFAASLCLCLTLNKEFYVNASVKWPNDLLLNGKKIAGLLSEMETRGDMVAFINIGIGINVNNHPQIHSPKAIALKDVLKKHVSRKKLLENLLDRLSLSLENLDSLGIIEQWKKHTSTIGRHVKIETLGDTFEGIARDVDESGALILEDGKGVQRNIIYGDCFHR